jgi:chorismate synthase
MSNTLGTAYRVTSFGESHGACVGVVVDGCPAGHRISLEAIQREMDRRRPGQSSVSTSRSEQDRVEVLSGVFKGVTTGAPICMIVWNRDADNSPYDLIRDTPRPGHADYTASVMYGGHQDYRGGGRFSGRNTAGLVMAGALARQVLAGIGVEVLSYTWQIGEVVALEPTPQEIRDRGEANPVRCPNQASADRMMAAIEEARKAGDSLGGKVACMALNVPPGLGQPVFDTLEGDLAKALFSVPAVKAVEFGAGVGHASMKGSESNDQYVIEDGRVRTTTNNSGGIHGGISNGMPITCIVTFKPTPSIPRPQRTVNLATHKETTIKVTGRHDPCIVPRAVPVVESVVATVLLDHALRRGCMGQVLEEER